MTNKPITILFDANPLVTNNKSGVGYYTQNLIQALADTYLGDIILIGHYFSFLGKKDKIPLPTGSNISYVRSRIIPGKILTFTRKFGFQPPLEFFFKRRGDVALFTNFVSLPSLTGIPKIVVIYDLSFIEVPEFVAEKNRKFLQKFVPGSIKSAAKVITISESTLRAIEKYYGTPSDNMAITPIPPGPKSTNNRFGLEALGVSKKFILFVSTLEPRKNVIGLVKAYERLPELIRREYQLVLAGGVGWYMEETMNYISKLQERGEQLITTGYISDEVRTALYEQATLFVMPSHYEGFGMPILEAMDYGVPVTLSDIPVFHEVAGNAALYFDKDDSKDIARSISHILNSESEKQKLIAAGKANIKRFSWVRSAKTTYDAIKEIAKS